MRLLAIVALFAACGSSSEQVGSSCSMASQCYPLVQNQSTIHGTVMCLTQYQGGYCTHTCASDADCCAVPGECVTGFKEVCSPFENQGQMYCFLSCASGDIQSAPNGGTTDPTAFCQRFAGSSLTCRSTGGGAGNRQFCG